MRDWCGIDAGWEFRIFYTFVWGYERGGSYVLCSHLRLLWARRFIVGVHACWTTSGQVRRVGLRAGRFVELDYERVGSWEHDNPWRPRLRRDLSHIGYEIRVWCYKEVNKLKLAKIKTGWGLILNILLLVLFFSAHPFCLCLAMIMWLVTWEHMWIQVSLLMHRDWTGQTMWWFTLCFDFRHL